MSIRTFGSIDGDRHFCDFASDPIHEISPVGRVHSLATLHSPHPPIVVVPRRTHVTMLCVPIAFMTRSAAVIGSATWALPPTNATRRCSAVRAQPVVDAHLLRAADSAKEGSHGVSKISLDFEGQT